MSRSTPRLLVSALSLTALLALAPPAHAAGSGGPLRDLPDTFRRWLTAVWQEIGPHIDPNGAQAPGEGGQSDIGMHIDPNGFDIGWEIDPNGFDIGWHIDPNG